MNIKRILILALALMVMAMPAGLAEAGYAALTLSNIHFSMAGMPEPLDIDAALTIGVGGQDDGSGRVDVALIGGGQTAFSGSAGFDAEKIQAIVGGSSYYFEIPTAALEAMTAASAGSGAPDMEKIKRLAEQYVKIIEKYANPEDAAKFAAPVMAVLNVEAKGQETVDLFGEPMELYRFDLTMNAEDIGKMYDAIFEADPDLKAFFADYLSLIAEMSDEELPFDPENFGSSFAKALEEAEVGMLMEMSVWTDSEDISATDSKAVKEAINITLTNLDSDDDSDIKTIEIPLTLSVLESDAGTRVAYEMSAAPDDDMAMAMAFDATLDQPTEDGGTASYGAFAMAFDSEDDDEDVDITLDFNATTDADNLARFGATLKLAAAGETMELSAGYEGATATETEQSGTVTLDFSIPEMGQGALAFDVKVETGAFTPLGEADLGGKTKINPLSEDEADQALMEEASVELNGVMMQAMGVLMQTPGLSNIMGGMMNAE